MDHPEVGRGSFLEIGGLKIPISGFPVVSEDKDPAKGVIPTELTVEIPLESMTVYRPPTLGGPPEPEVTYRFPEGRPTERIDYRPERN